MKYLGNIIAYSKREILSCRMLLMSETMQPIKFSVKFVQHDNKVKTNLTFEHMLV